jgi:hypothetical protein
MEPRILYACPMTGVTPILGSSAPLAIGAWRALLPQRRVLKSVRHLTIMASRARRPPSSFSGMEANNKNHTPMTHPL